MPLLDAPLFRQSGWRNPEQPYHVDYCFAPEHWLDDNAVLEVVQPGAPAVLSDHWALILEAAAASRNA